MWIFRLRKGILNINLQSIMSFYFILFFFGLLSCGDDACYFVVRERLFEQATLRGIRALAHPPSSLTFIIPPHMVNFSQCLKFHFCKRKMWPTPNSRRFSHPLYFHLSRDLIFRFILFCRIAQIGPLHVKYHWYFVTPCLWVGCWLFFMIAKFLCRSSSHTFAILACTHHTMRAWCRLSFGGGKWVLAQCFFPPPTFLQILLSCIEFSYPTNISTIFIYLFSFVLKF